MDIGLTSRGRRSTKIGKNVPPVLPHYCGVEDTHTLRVGTFLAVSKTAANLHSMEVGVMLKVFPKQQESDVIQLIRLTSALQGIPN